MLIFNVRIPIVASHSTTANAHTEIEENPRFELAFDSPVEIYNVKFYNQPYWEGRAAGMITEVFNNDVYFSILYNTTTNTPAAPKHTLFLFGDAVGHIIADLFGGNREYIDFYSNCSPFRFVNHGS